VSSPSSHFECHWQPSLRLLVVCLLALLLACLALLGTQSPGWLRLLALTGCLAYAGWVIQGPILLRRATAFRGLRRTGGGWEVWSPAAGWQAIQLRPDSLALPALVVLRFRLAGEWRARGLCIPADALPAALHRQLRLRLKFSRRRWAAAE
jgi:toxin CptA